MSGPRAYAIGQDELQRRLKKLHDEKDLIVNVLDHLLQRVVVSLADEDIVAAIAGTQDAQADSSSFDEDCLDEAVATRSYCAAEVAVVCGDME
ncbi:hypothetical protein HPB52_017226 [Rhipicephalus sanguineus]|uniref:Uncharacterized protein n=1 Tax=Rhipicephalus sanguineus TaxID=34632 RepID=A0A9D4TB01_RHISA|nr:hypothetical protein HPB52_017226 [Rhipicephalus sanguineus]